MFKDIDAEYIMKRKLMNLQQREWAASYAAEFQRIASHVN